MPTRWCIHNIFGTYLRDIRIWINPKIQIGILHQFRCQRRFVLSECPCCCYYYYYDHWEWHWHWWCAERMTDHCVCTVAVAVGVALSLIDCADQTLPTHTYTLQLYTTSQAQHLGICQSADQTSVLTQFIISSALHLGMIPHNDNAAYYVQFIHCPPHLQTTGHTVQLADIPLPQSRHPIGYTK